MQQASLEYFNTTSVLDFHLPSSERCIFPSTRFESLNLEIAAATGSRAFSQRLPLLLSSLCGFRPFGNPDFRRKLRHSTPSESHFVRAAVTIHPKSGCNVRPVANNTSPSEILQAFSRLSSSFLHLLLLLSSTRTRLQRWTQRGGKFGVLSVERNPPSENTLHLLKLKRLSSP
ncbi:hypothetical protein GOODEAATRI_022189 [Goodea atripinnis]|uniref:Uncharacterized protein n=1 Tax=Goodea atripinnis TaxID=208336 RepID=A0ABV0PG46_9TELE